MRELWKHPSADEDKPVLPPELILKIVKCFPARSRTLVEMMCACRAMRELVRPHFISEVDTEAMFDTLARMLNFVDWGMKHSSFRFVRKLTLGWKKGVAWEVLKFIVRLCGDGVEYLDLDFPSIEEARDLSEIRSDSRLHRLRRLTLHLDYSYGNSQALELDLPALRTFRHFGPCESKLFEAVARGCPSLDSVECQLREWPSEDFESFIPEEFLAKTKTWIYVNLEVGFSIQHRSDAFHPVAIEACPFRAETMIHGENWDAAIGTDSLRKASLSRFLGEWFSWGMPKNLARS